MINYSGMSKKKVHKVLRRRLQDLRKEPDNKFIHFDIAEGVNALHLDTYQISGKVIKKTAGIGTVMTCIDKKSFNSNAAYYEKSI